MRIIVVGAGEVGFNIARRLVDENKDVIFIDKSSNALKRVSEQLDVQTIQGSGSSPQVLKDAEIENADIFLAVTDSDEANLIASFFAHALAPKVTKIARIRNEEYTGYKQVFSGDVINLDMIINPEVETVKSVMRLIDVPGVHDINEFADGRIVMAGVKVDEGSPMSGVGLLDFRDKVGLDSVIIGAIIRDNVLLIPTGTDIIKAGDIAYVVCARSNLQSIVESFGKRAQPLRNIFIVGGGNIGARLAQALDKKQYQVKLVDCDPMRSHYLSAKLDRPVVLLGDGTDKELLDEENISNMDIVIALTGNDETNVLSCLLAKSLGARKTIARVNKFPYMPVVEAIGIEHIVSTRLSAVNSILHAVRRGVVLTSVSIKGEEAEAMEAVALQNSEIVGRPIKDIRFPKGAIILSILRGEQIIIPTGDFVIEPEDRIIVLALRQSVPRVEKALSVELESL